MDKIKLTEHLKEEEGLVLYAYDDATGKEPLEGAIEGYLTIGYGHLIDKRKGGGISEMFAELLLENDINKSLRDLVSNFSWYSKIGESRQIALCAMRFQMGMNSLLGFKKMLKALEQGDYMQAHKEALDSKWYREDTPERAKRVADMFLIDD